MNLTTQDLARLLGQFLEEKQSIPGFYLNETLEEKIQYVSYQVVENLKDWLIAQDTNTNPHRYSNNPDLPQELDNSSPPANNNIGDLIDQGRRTLAKDLLSALDKRWKAPNSARNTVSEELNLLLRNPTDVGVDNNGPES